MQNKIGWVCLISGGLFFNLFTSCIVFMSRPSVLLLAFGAEKTGVLFLVEFLGWRCKCVRVLEKGVIYSALTHFRVQEDFLGT